MHKADKHFGHDPCADGAKAFAVAADLRLFEDVVPKRRCLVESLLRRDGAVWSGRDLGRGQRALDVSDETRAKVLAVLHGLKIPAAWPEMVERLVEMAAGDRGQLFGESLPIGLRLVG